MDDESRPDPLAPPRYYGETFRLPDVPSNPLPLEDAGAGAETAPCHCQGCCQPCPNTATQEDLNCDACRQRENCCCSGQHSQGLRAENTEYISRLESLLRDNNYITRVINASPDITRMSGGDLQWEWKTFDVPSGYARGSPEPGAMPKSLEPTDEYMRRAAEVVKKQIREAYGIDPDTPKGTDGP